MFVLFIWLQKRSAWRSGTNLYTSQNSEKSTLVLARTIHWSEKQQAHMTDRNSRVTCSGEWASNNCGSRGPSTLPASSSVYSGGGGGNKAKTTSNTSAHVHYIHYVEYVSSAHHVFSTQSEQYNPCPLFNIQYYSSLSPPHSLTNLVEVSVCLHLEL